MSSPGLLCLKWNNHTSAFDKLLNNLHLREVYSDGTIVCHGNFYPVHRFVLSTCSEYFEEIFRQSINLKSKHPFIIVKDVHPPQMEALLNYMYRGEVNVPQEMLPELIKAAEAFKIKGLAVPDNEPTPSKSSSSKDRKRSSASLSSPCSQVKKSRRGEDSLKKTKTSLQSDDEMRNSSSMSKICSSSNSQKDTEELLITGIPLGEVKSEPCDIQDFNETEEIPEQTAPSEEDYLLSKKIDIKEEKSFESYATAEPFPPYEDDENPAADDQFDLAQSSSWDNSQGFEGNSNLEEGDSAQGILGHPENGTAGSNQDYLWNSSQLTQQSSSSNKCFKCKFCSYQSKWEGELKEHRKTHKGKKKFKCTQCPYKGTQKIILQRHMRTHTGEKPFQCNQCPYKVTQNSYLQIHMRTHTGENPFKCTQCSYKAANNINLQRHTRMHPVEKPFVCQFCNYKSAFKFALQRHLNRRH